MKLKNVLKEFSISFGRNGFDIGELLFNSFVNNEDNNLEAFYMFLDFSSIITIGGELFMNIIPKNLLSLYQRGYYFIKTGNEWVADENHWNKKWIIFANRNDDGIFFNEEDGSINGTIDKKQFYKISSSICNFFIIINQAIKIESEKYNFNTSDTEEETLMEFKDDIYQIIIGIESQDIADDFMSFFFE